MLYVPDISAVDSCTNISTQYIPDNVTRRRNLPTFNTLLFAVIPWISQECTKSYLSAANHDSVSACITYLPNNHPGIPPPGNDPAWAMSDGGQWKANNPFPVYAIPGPIGALLMKALSQYSGNGTTVPNGTLIAEDYDNPNYVRLYATVGTDSTGSLPTLWEFLLIVLGIVILLIFTTSAVMHFNQRKHRQDLRNRVVSGEVDLEYLGIKRMIVPQEVLDKLPLYVYTASERDPGDQPTQFPEPLRIPEPGISRWRPTPNPNFQTRSVSEPLQVTNSPSASTILSDSNSQHIPSYAQPTCSICFDEFIAHTTPVRELPCHHIYHPTCIDLYLRNHSSFCPLCKARVLPQGYCPVRITNAMVRRERHGRRLAGHTSNPSDREDEEQLGPTSGPTRTQLLGHRLPSFHRQFGRPTPQLYWPGSRRISSAPPLPPPHTSLEMATTPAPAPAMVVQQAIPQGLLQGGPAWGRNSSGMLGGVAFMARQVRDPDEDERFQRARLPKCTCKFLFPFGVFMSHCC